MTARLDNTKLEKALAAIDIANARDPAREAGIPAALLYGQRMTAEQRRLFPDASEVFQIACRGQHIERWTLPRSAYPEGRPGYLQWRQEQGRRHAARVAGIMADAGYDAVATDRVRVLLTKQGLKRDAEVQALEDVICFTFLRWYLDGFSSTQPDHKLARIVEKTARKMSPEARARALIEFNIPAHLAAFFADSHSMTDLDGVVIVSHGQPGDPGPQQRAIETLAEQVASHLPGVTIRGATLAMPGALAAAATSRSLVYPMFMAEGWFTGIELPRRLTEAKAGGARITRPFGADPALPELVMRRAQQAARHAGWAPENTTLLLAAHGSQRSQASANMTRALARQIAPHFAEIRTGFVEQKPFIAEAARGLGQAVMLPLFALRAEHVLRDLPDALDEAGFTGPRLDPIGLAPEVPEMIAQTLRAELERDA